MKLVYTFATLSLVLLFSCTKTVEPVAETTDSDAIAVTKAKPGPTSQSISFRQENLFPEGVVYDKFNDRFYVSSTTRGDIGIVTRDGIYTPFITDPALVATAGLAIDEARKLLYVTNATDGSVGIYDTRTGQRVNFIDLKTLLPGTPVFINDIIIDPQGNAYVTNSFAPVIYKIDRSGTATIFYQEPALTTAPGGFGFNGIEYANTGFLLVAYTIGNQIIKIPIKDPSSYSIVMLDRPINRPDGLLLSKDNKQLVVVSNAGGSAQGSVTYFISDDKWTSATATGTFTTGAVFPTTATTDGKQIFVLYAYLHRRAAGQNEFAIQPVPLATTMPF